ncbi:hypothetical protein JCM30237_21870 [Halolamina litorea]|uniref:Uncharacterized protein n=1 Tax=Halolamina litorea TaxID=1515593 RepID=A0ABD6BQ18_9EURY|nr:hypothetical protein [Halolamina litorea]
MATNSTPWPLALALGLAMAELGVFLGFAAIAAPGVVFFTVSLAGAIDEAGYGRSRPFLLAVVAAAVALLGVVAAAVALPIRGYSMVIGAVAVLPLAVLDHRR